MKPGARVSPTRTWAEAVRGNVSRLPRRGRVERVETTRIGGRVAWVAWDGGVGLAAIRVEDLVEVSDG